MKRLVMALGGAVLLWSAGAEAQTAPSNFYLRVDAGGSFPSSNDLKQFDASPIVGAGIGAKILPFLRTDVTVSYRTNYAGTNNDTTTLPGFSINEKSDLNSLVGMVNAYYDFPKIVGLTPYVGGGVGIARNELGSTTGAVAGTQILALNGDTKTNFAWQVGAGAAVALTPGIALDISYHYLDAGKFTTGTSGTVLGIPVSGIAATTGRLQAHEVQAGIRVGF